MSYITRMADQLQGVNRTVYKMERTGVCVDLGVLHEIEAKALGDAADSLTWIDNYVGAYTGRLAWRHNWNYAQWLVGVLHNPRGTGDDAGLALTPSPYWSKGKVKPGERKTDSRALEYLAAVNPEHRSFLNRIRTYRRQFRMAGYARTWIDLAIKHTDGSFRLHPSFGMATDSDPSPGARTGRFGVKNPALQQVPRDKRKDPYRLRRAFIAPPGHVLLVADYSQLEVVILAHLCSVLFGSHILIDRLIPGAPDLHSATAARVFAGLGQSAITECPIDDLKEHPVWGKFRDQIKAIRYGLNYCKGAWGFGSTLFEVDLNGEISGPPIGEEAAQLLIDQLLAFDPEIAEFQRWVRAYITKHAAIPSLAGRWSPLPGAKSKEDWERNRAWRQACNWPMQAGGQEITAAAMLGLDAAGFTLDLQVHDEIHAYVPEDQADARAVQMRTIMETAWPLRSYLKAVPKYGKSWEQTK